MKIKQKEILKSNRLTLKPFSQDDIDRLSYLLCDDVITKTFMVPIFESENQKLSLISKIVEFSKIEDEDHLEYGIYLEDLLIGFVNDCGHDESSIEIGYVIDPKYHGKGYASEAVNLVISDLKDMGFKKVIAGYFEGNIASYKVMKNCGMHEIDEEEVIEYRGGKHKCYYLEKDL